LKIIHFVLTITIDLIAQHYFYIYLKMNQKYISFISLIIVFSFINLNAQVSFLNENTFKISRTLDYLNSLYVDTVNQSALTETAIRAMIKELDPHSAYLNVEEVKELNEPLQGNFEGIGVSFNILHIQISRVGI